MHFGSKLMKLSKKMYVIILLLVTLLVVKISHWFYTWANPECSNGKLPPGSMGFPIIGETVDFFRRYSLYEIQPFITKRMDRYGSVFRTSIAGQKVIVSADPETNHSIMNEENKSLLFWCTDGLNKIFGDQNWLSQHGSVHKYLRSLAPHLTGREILRQKFLHEIDETTRRHLHSWASCGTVNVRETCAEMVFESSSKKLMSYDERKYSKKLRQNYKAFKLGIVSFPLYIPGTAFYESLKAHKHILKVIKDIYEERKASKVPGHDFLDCLIEEVEKENAVLDEAKVIDFLFVLIFAGFETISQSITLITKYITDHPDVLAELTKEHETILNCRADDGNSEITWEEYKSMSFTHMVINEIIRLANIIPVTFRKVLKDMEINGYTVPAGWVIMMVLPIVHFDPQNYENPLAFNPWRWKGKELHTGTKTFVGFGGGVRLCIGADFAKLHLAVYIHYLVTKYRWSVIRGGEVFKQPALKFPNGLHIKIAEKHD